MWLFLLLYFYVLYFCGSILSCFQVFFDKFMVYRQRWSQWVRQRERQYFTHHSVLPGVVYSHDKAITKHPRNITVRSGFGQDLLTNNIN